MDKELINYKLFKYSSKFKNSNNSYHLFKLSKHIYNKLDQLGGNITNYTKTNNTNTNIEQLNKIITDLFKDKVKQQTPYLVILMGSPGVGKSIARKIAMKPIKEQNNLSTDYKTQFNTFVDIGIDDFVEKYMEKLKSGKELIKEKTQELQKLDFNTFYDEKSNKLKRKQVNFIELEKIYKASFETYSKIRKHIEPICDIMMYIAVYLGINIFFETTGSNYDYLKKMIDEYTNYHKYKVIVMYPYMNNDYEHAKRIFKRGIEEGRIPDINKVIKNKQQIERTYKKLVSVYKKSSIVKLYKYDSELVKKEEIDAFNLENVDFLNSNSKNFFNLSFLNFSRTKEKPKSDFSQIIFNKV